MDWETVCNLILNSIQIVGIFIAIIIGLIISKVMDLKKEKNELEKDIYDINIELKTMNEEFKKLKIDNYNYYKEENIIDIIDIILDNKRFVGFNPNIYITKKEEKDFYFYVKKYINITDKLIKKGIDLEECKLKLGANKNSIEDTIIEELYNRSDY